MKKKMLLTLAAVGLGSLFMAGTAFAAADLQLNPDVLKAEKEDYYHEWNGPYDGSYSFHNNERPAGDIFIGADNGNFTFSDIRNCLDKYGVSYTLDADEVFTGYRIQNANLFIGALFDDGVEEYGNGLPEKEFSGDSEFELYFTDGYNEVTEEFWYTGMDPIDAFIAQVEAVNNGGSGAANGWQEENGIWKYYENGAGVTGWKEIEGKWYYFDDAGNMAANLWIGDYYVGSDGAMLTSTTTPDGYQVGADGAWIRE